MLLFIGAARVYAAYLKSRNKGFLYFAAFLFIVALSLVVEGLPGILIHNALVINIIHIIGYSYLLFISLAFLSQVSFQWMKKPALGNFFFWAIIIFGIIALYSNISAHHEAVKLESTLKGIPTLVYWHPNFTFLSIGILVITSIINILCFPFLLAVFASRSSTSKAGRTRAILMTTGLLISGFFGLAFFILHGLAIPYLVEILTVDTFAIFICLIIFDVSFFIKLDEGGEEKKEVPHSASFL